MSIKKYLNLINCFLFNCLFLFLYFLSQIVVTTANLLPTSKSYSPAANNDFFQEIGAEIGVDFVHSIGEKDLNNIIESVGGEPLSWIMTRTVISICMFAVAPGSKDSVKAVNRINRPGIIFITTAVMEPMKM